jgi:hypothetical protein
LKRVAPALALAAAACSPTLDWREVRPADSAVQALFPCKPASQARRVTLAGSVVEMSLFACAAGDVTYALAFADLRDPARVTTALDELARAAHVNLQAAPGASSEPVRVPGMTPNPSALVWRIDGRLPDGKAVAQRSALFAYGTRVYQASVLGAGLDAAAADAFVDALRVRE